MKKYLIISILLAMAIVAALGLTNNVVCTRYTLASKKITDSLKLVVIADFQGCEYGEHNEPILKLVSDEKPGIVLLCGDIYDDELPFDRSDELVRQLSDVWPVYYVSGNHEYWSGRIDTIKEKLTAYGVHVLGGSGELVHIRKDTELFSGIPVDLVVSDHAHGGQLRIPYCKTFQLKDIFFTG